MATINRIVIPWSGVNGFPGVCVFYSPSASTTAVTNIGALFASVKPLLPNGLTISIPGTGDQINDATGALVGVWTMSGSTTQVGSGGTGAWAAGCGARIKWLTGGIVNGRRVRGATFIAPLMAAQYDTNGTLLNTAVTTMSNAASTLAATGDTLIWSRPFAGAPGNPARSGSSYTVLSGFCPDQVTSLRSRRT